MNKFISNLGNIKEIILKNKTFTKSNKEKLSDLLKEINQLNHKTNVLDELITKSKLTGNDKLTFEKNVNELIETLQNNDNSIIAVNNELTKIVELVDNTIYKYSEKNPMIGVSWNEKNKTWLIINNELQLNTKSKYIEKACDKVKNKISIKNQLFKLEIYAKNNLQYKSKNIILYNSIKEAYFDIKQIINLLDLCEDKTKKKYNEYSKYIVSCTWSKNQYGGYILKEFITEEIMYQIILSSNSEFSKHFKKDISKLLVELRQSGDLIVKDDCLKLNKKEINCEQINEIVLIESNIWQYDDLIVQNKIINLVTKSQHISLSQYMYEHVLYMFIVALQGKDKNVYCKFGYSADIIERISSLKNEYGTKMYLVGIHIIKNQSVEKKFHTMLQTKYPNNHVTPVYKKMGHFKRIK
jgi:prophage antirepressor-like protein